MKFSFAAEHGKTASSRNSVVFWLLGFVICSQVIYQICMSFALHQDNTILDPWCSGAQTSAQQCVEAKLFQSWQGPGHNDPLDLLESEEQLNGLLEHHVDKHALPAESAAAKNSRHERRLHDAHSAIHEFHNMSTLSRDLKELHDSFGARLAARRDHTQSAKAEFSNLTSWAGDVHDLQKHFEAQFIPTPLNAAPAPEADNMTAWSHNIDDLQHRMEARMAAHNKAHDTLEAHYKAHHHVPEAKKENGHALLEQIAALGKAMCSDAKHLHDPHCAQFRTSVAVHSPPAATTGILDRSRSTKLSSLDEAEAQLNGDLHKLAEKQHDWEKSFVAKVSNTLHDFCSDSVHRTQPTCVEFLSKEAKNNHHHHHDHQSSKAKMTHVGEEFCNNPIRREYAICKKIFAERAATLGGQGTPPSTKSDSSENDEKVHGNKSPRERSELHWSAVTQRNERTTKGLRGSVATGNVATISDVTGLRRYAHWSGRVPSVACITVVPQGSAAKATMQYFIDNFRLQHYEGGHQLLLVYHHSDKHAAELVRKHADGTYIKGVVARGDDFSPASASRFGAWIAHESDVIARWDFGAWHHPNRLSMQVRSLAHAKRPASLLERWTVFDKSGANTTVLDGEHWDSSLLGEAAWMGANWYPYMDEERNSFHKQWAQDLVKLDDASLQVFDEGSL